MRADAVTYLQDRKGYNDMSLAHPVWLLLLLCLVLPWLVYRYRGYIGYSHLNLLKRRRVRFLHKVPAALLCLSFVALTVAIAQPEQAYQKPTGQVLARDVIFGIDISGSMTTPFVGTVPAPNPACFKALGQLPPGALKAYEKQQEGGYGGYYTSPTGTREAAAGGAVENFICQSYLSNSGDRIGIEEFSDSPTWLWPLTTDLKMPFRQAEFIPYALGGGTNFGEEPPGPIDYGAQMFKQLGQSKSRIFIMVTDGEDDLGPQVVARLVALIRANHIHFYVIGVAENLLADNADIAKVATQTGGTVFMAQSEQQLNKAVQTVDRLTRTPVTVETSTAHNELFWFFGDAFIILFLLGLAGEAVVLRR